MKNTEFGKPASRTFVRKMFFSVVYVMMVTAIISTFVVIVQGVCIQNLMGDLGKLATEAEQLALPVFAFGTFFCYTFGFGLQILVSRYINTTRREEISRYFTASMILNLGVIIFFLLLGNLLQYQIAKLLGADSDHIQYTSNAIQGFFNGFVFHCLFRSIQPSMYLKDMKKYSYISTFAMISTSVLMFLLIGYLCPNGPDKMLWFGFSTTAPYLGGMVVVIIYFVVKRKSNIFKFTFKGLKGYHFGHLFVCGTPTGLRKFSFALYILVLNEIIMAIDGQSGGALAASAVQMRYQTLLVVFSSGIYYSGAVMSSYFKNLGDREYYQEYLRFMTIVCGTFMVVVAALFIGLAEPLTWLYGAIDAEYTWAIVAIRWYAAALPFITFSGIWLSVYQGSGNWKWMYPSIIWQDFFPLIFVAACGFAGKTISADWAKHGIFFGEFLGAFMVLVVHFFLGWIVNKGRPFSAEAQYLLNKKLLCPKEKILRHNLNTKSQQNQFFLELNAFCKTNHISQSKKEKVIEQVNCVLKNTIKSRQEIVTGVVVTKSRKLVRLYISDTFIDKNNKKECPKYVEKIRSLYPNMLYSNEFNFNEYIFTI